MKALIYLLKTTIKNYFKRLKEKPQKAIGPIFVGIWLMTMFIPRGGKAEDGMPPEAFVSLFLVFTLIMFIYSLYSGTKKVKSQFNMSDVNLIFVSPIRPQTVLLYGIVKKIAVELLASMYLLYQIPNILRGANVPGSRQALLMISYLIFQLFLCNIVKLFIFSLSTKYKGFGRSLRNIIKAFIVCLVAGTALLGYSMGGEKFFEEAFAFVKGVTYSPGVKYIPLVGWLREIALQTMTGINAFYWISVLLIIALSGILLYITYRMELDFYEDMLSSAEENDFVKEVKSGNKVAGEGKKTILTKVFRKVKLNLDERYGAKVLFFKHLNESMKRSFLFFINTYSIILLALSIILGRYAKGIEIRYMLLVASGLLFFGSGLGGRIYNEINYYFIFLMPDSPLKKLFYGIASSFIKLSLDAALLFIPFGILASKSPIEVVFSIICYVLLGGMLSFSGLFAFRIAEFLGFTGIIASALFFSFFQLFLAVPLALITLLIPALLKISSAYFVYLGILAYSIIGGVLFSYGAVGVLNNMEFRDNI